MPQRQYQRAHSRISAGAKWRRLNIASAIAAVPPHTYHQPITAGLPVFETEQKRYPHAELAARERLDLNLSWLKQAGAADPSTLPPPAEIAASIADELETALSRFRAVAARLNE